MKNKMKDWKVVHILRGERMTKEQFATRYPNEMQLLAVKIINVLSEKHGIEVKFNAS